MAAQAQEETDYAEAGRQLLSRVNLDQGSLPAVQRYSPYNAIWRHPKSGATLYVGNATTASNRETLEEIECSRIVFCQDSDGKCHFEVRDFRQAPIVI